MSRTIDLPAFRARHADGALVLDVREPGEYLSGHVPGARLAPSAQPRAALDALESWGTGARRRPVHVICQSGNRSGVVTDQLRQLGYDAVSVAGGTSAWVAAGLPVHRGPHAS